MELTWNVIAQKRLKILYIPFTDGREERLKEKIMHVAKSVWDVWCFHKKNIRKKVSIYTALSPYPPPSPDVFTLVSDCARAAKAAKRRTTSASTLSQRSDRV